MDKKQLIEIEELEKQYFQALHSAIENNTELIERKIKYLNKTREHWEGALKLDNAIQIVIQELIRSIIFRAFTDWESFSSPICSDTAFETEDAIVNLDVKTVKNSDNDVKQGYLQVRRNQISYPNKPIKGIPWVPHQPVEMEMVDGQKLHTFSYFVKFIWARESKEIKIKEVVICSVPNGKLSQVYGNDLLVNYKTYPQNKNMEKEEIDEKTISKKWQTPGWNFITIRETGQIYGKNKKETKAWGNQWHYMDSGDTARFNIKKIKEPKLTEDWERIKSISFNSENQAKLS